HGGNEGPAERNCTELFDFQWSAGGRPGHRWIHDLADRRRLVFFCKWREFSSGDCRSRGDEDRAANGVSIWRITVAKLSRRLSFCDERQDGTVGAHFAQHAQLFWFAIYGIHARLCKGRSSEWRARDGHFDEHRGGGR